MKNVISHSLKLSCAVLVLFVFSSGLALAEYGLNMPKGVTEISREVYGLHMKIFYWCVGIAVVVFYAIIHSIIFHRKSRGYKAATFHHSTVVEIVWTIIPFIILIVMAIPAAKTLIAMESTESADITIKITGYQWKWRYEYLDGDAAGVSFFSSLATPLEQISGEQDRYANENYLLEVDNALVLPTGKKVRFLLTAADVIHAWWIPDFAVKKDAIPGFINEMWTVIDEPGTYRGQCAELCGKDHGFMPIVVIAKSEAEYEQWVRAQPNAAILKTDVAVGQ